MQLQIWKKVREKGPSTIVFKTDLFLKKIFLENWFLYDLFLENYFSEKLISTIAPIYENL